MTNTLHLVIEGDNTRQIRYIWLLRETHKTNTLHLVIEGDNTRQIRYIWLLRESAQDKYVTFGY